MSFGMDGDNVTVSQCPTCDGPFVDIHQLECDHMTCIKCLNKHTEYIDNEPIVTCPYPKCDRETSRENSKPLQLFDRAKYEIYRSQHRDKAMEDDLLVTAKEMGLDHHSNQAAATIAQCLELEKLSIEDKTCTNIQSKPEATKWDAMPVLAQLWDATQNCKDIRGFYENNTGDKIIVDVAEGSHNTVVELLKKHFQSDMVNSRIDIVQQSSPTKYLIAIGAKVATNHPNFGQYIDQHPDMFRETDYFGTVSCLGTDSTDKLYILTAKHIFGDTQLQHEQGSFLSSSRSKITEVSRSYHGVLGGELIAHSKAPFPWLIDIAALPLEDTIETDLTSCPYLVHDLQDKYTGNYADSSRLKGQIVFKNGAVSGYTCGRIIIPNYFGRHGDMMGNCFVIESQDVAHKFAEQGDSGSLIWSTDGKPLGIVSFHSEALLHEGVKICATFGVRLDYCLEALRRNTGINILKCKAYGSPIPVIRQNPAPSDAAFDTSSSEVVPATAQC